MLQMHIETGSNNVYSNWLDTLGSNTGGFIGFWW